jgi:hypothetical protein
MIPPVIGQDASPGEVEVFRGLAECPGTDDWIVLHSLNIAQHVRQTQGEADFFIIVPSQGMVIVEIKSHRNIHRDANGLWRLGNDAPTRRSPFSQASNNMHSIRKYLIDRGFDLTGVPVCNAVWFTHVRARAMLPASPEWHRWQVLDSTDLQGDIRSAVLSVLRQGAQHLVESRGPQMVEEGKPTPSQCDAALRLLRPKFDLVVAGQTERKLRQDHLLRLLDEQYDALDQVADNRAVLMTGPAGSGKTLIAMEAARRAQQLGESSWLLCYNRNLGLTLEEETEGLPSVSGGSFHRLALRISGLPVPTEATAKFWEEELPLAAAMQLLEDDQWRRDFLVVDEAQDLLRPPVLDVLDLLVKGGLGGGRCLFLGDFERQALYGCEDGRAELESRVGGVTRYRLTANCRNLPRIGHAVEQLSGMQPGYSRFRRLDDGEQPRYRWLPSTATREQTDGALAASVRELTESGFHLEDIVVLSPNRDSAAENAQDPWLQQILIPVDGTKNPRGRLRYGTIHSFKGLEADAIIVTDLVDATVPGFENLLYVGLTRARDRLHVISPKEVIGGIFLGKAGT